MDKPSQRQTKSKLRVSNHGEVFTDDREVNAMLDLVKQETERIDSRFLEPACGDGNFLAEILRRKLGVVKTRYGKNRADYERYAVIAITSIYGVDILPDNVEECRERLFDIWHTQYKAIMKKSANSECYEAVRFILSKNILCGDALTLRQADGTPIIFAEWSIINEFLIKRRDYRLDGLLEEQIDKNQDLQPDLFSKKPGWEYDEDIQAFIPLPIREFPPIHYRKVQVND